MFSSMPSVLSLFYKILFGCRHKYLAQINRHTHLQCRGFDIPGGTEGVIQCFFKFLSFDKTLYLGLFHLSMGLKMYSIPLE